MGGSGGGGGKTGDSVELELGGGGEFDVAVHDVGADGLVFHLNYNKIWKVVVEWREWKREKLCKIYYCLIDGL